MSVKQMVGEQTTNNNDATGSFDDIHKHQWGALFYKRPPLMLYLGSYPLLLAVSCRYNIGSRSGKDQMSAKTS